MFVVQNINEVTYFRQSCHQNDQKLTKQTNFCCTQLTEECENSDLNKSAGLGKKMKAISLTMRRKMGKKHAKSFSEETVSHWKIHTRTQSLPLLGYLHRLTFISSRLMLTSTITTTCPNLTLTLTTEPIGKLILSPITQLVLLCNHLRAQISIYYINNVCAQMIKKPLTAAAHRKSPDSPTISLVTANHGCISKECPE